MSLLLMPRAIRYLMTGKEETCMKKILCRSSNLIYCITCNVCGMQYVGQTMRRLRNRFYNHYFHIRESIQDKAVSRHMAVDQFSSFRRANGPTRHVRAIGLALSPRHWPGTRASPLARCRIHAIGPAPLPAPMARCTVAGPLARTSDQKKPIS